MGIHRLRMAKVSQIAAAAFACMMLEQIPARGADASRDLAIHLQKSAYTIEARSLDVKGDAYCGPDGAGKAISYVVKKDGKPLKPAVDAAQQPLTGCRVAGAAPDIEVVRIGERVLGWLVSVHYGTNPVYWQSHLIVVQPGFAAYGVRGFSSSEVKPLFALADGNLEVWLSQTEQLYGTASYFPYTERIVLDLRDPNLLASVPSLNADVTKWPSNFRCSSYQSCFVTGLKNHNPDLLDYAVDLFLDEKKSDDWQFLNLPSTKAEGKAFVATFRHFKRTFDDYLLQRPHGS